MLAQKYFRKAGIPTALKPVAEEGVPEFLWRKRSRRQGNAPARHSAKEVFDRLAGTWAYWGWKGGYFDGEADARAFYDEMCYMLATQKARAELAAMVQHRPALGLWHRWPEPGPLLCRSQHRPADEIGLVL